MTAAILDHPAKFSPNIIDYLKSKITPDMAVLDPFGGVGGIHELDADTSAVEIELEWAMAAAQTYPGRETYCWDSTKLTDLYDEPIFDAIVTSPSYGNRFADQYVGPPERRTRSYARSLGRRCTAGSGAALQYGDEYQRLHASVIKQFPKVLKPEGFVLINVSNHIRKKQEVDVVGWWHDTMLRNGWTSTAMTKIPTQRYRAGANNEARVDGEWVLEFNNWRKPE